MVLIIFMEILTLFINEIDINFITFRYVFVKLMKKKWGGK